jgi:hypothetical protein
VHTLSTPRYVRRFGRSGRKPGSSIHGGGGGVAHGTPALVANGQGLHTFFTSQDVKPTNPSGVVAGMGLFRAGLQLILLDVKACESWQGR